MKKLSILVYRIEATLLFTRQPPPANCHIFGLGFKPQVTSGQALGRHQGGATACKRVQHQLTFTGGQGNKGLQQPRSPCGCWVG